MVINILKLIANLAAFVFLVVLSWRMLGPASDSMRFHEVSPDLSLPMIVHWILMVGGIALALLPATLILIENVRELMARRTGQ